MIDDILNFLVIPIDEAYLRTFEALVQCVHGHSLHSIHDLLNRLCNKPVLRPLRCPNHYLGVLLRPRDKRRTLESMDQLFGATALSYEGTH